MRALLLAALAVAACDDRAGPSGGPWIEATARVDGAFVVVDYHCLRGSYTPALIVETGTKLACEAKRATLRLPAAKLGAGPHTLTFGDEYRSVPPYKVAIDVPASALQPYFSVDKCTFESSGIQMGLTVDKAPEIDCWGAGGARAALHVIAPANAQLQLGGKTVTVPPSGELEQVVDFSDALLAMSIDDAVSRGDGNPITIPYQLVAGNQTLAGTLAFATKFGQHAKLVETWLADIAAGKIDRPAFTPVTPGQRATLLVVPIYGDFDATDRRGTLRTAGYVAIVKAGKRTEHGTCQLDDKAKGAITAKRFLVEHDVTVTRLADGKVVAHKTFAPDPEKCPMLAYVQLDHPEVEATPSGSDVKAWLDTLTTATLE